MVRHEDMPFVASGPNEGMRPDVIINLQCINGRMTIGKLLEMLHGALGVVQGEIQDATPFFNVSAKWALEELARCSYSDRYTMISGTTGEVFEQPWFLGVCFYQRLKHHVLDKIAARARGVRAVLTRQPVDGRANNGGQKFGEMEFDALKAAGAPHVSFTNAQLECYKRSLRSLSLTQQTLCCPSCTFWAAWRLPTSAFFTRMTLHDFVLMQVLHDRSVLASDVFDALICKSCGTMGDTSTPSLGSLMQGDGYECRACGAKNDAVELQTTYCYSGLLVKELAAMGIAVEHKLT